MLPLLNFDKVTIFISRVKKMIKDPSFIHHEWYDLYHLNLMERIAEYMIEKYYQGRVNINWIRLLIYLHDYGKIVDRENKYQTTYIEGKQKLIEVGLPDEIAWLAVDMIKSLDEKENLQKASLELQIVSSADGASHLIGPFYYKLWQDRPDFDFEKMIQKHREKLETDWNKKIVLPEFKKIYKPFYEFHRMAVTRLIQIPES